MKRLIILLGAVVSMVACINMVDAQNSSEGTIVYEVRTNMHRRIPKEREQMKSMIPEFRTEKVQLSFNANESLYKSIIEDSEDQMASTPSGGGMQIRIGTPKLELYLDNATQQRYAVQEFLGKEYLVIDTLKISPWKFGTETKTIAGYECKQAYYTDESNPNQKQEITAWYTDKIRPFLGPDRFQSLPGTILAVDINNAERVLVAKQIDLRPLKKNELQKPSKGTPISQAGFRAMVDEQIKKNGGNGTFIIQR